MRRFDSATSWSAPSTDELSGAGIRMESPARAANLASDLLVPFGQALITGLTLSGLITFLYSRTDYAGDLAPLFLGLLLFIGAATWLILLTDTRKLLRTIEELTGIDIDGDGTAGTPPVKEKYIAVNAQAARKEAAQIDAERQEAEETCELAEFVARIPTLGTDSRTWEKRMSREQYTAFRGLLIEMGWATWNSTQDKRQGWRLVLPVREILQRISADE